MRADLFIGAQALVYEQAVAELRAGEKRGHWMWCVFPQIAGLGESYRSQLFGLTSTDAVEYLAHPVLGRRLSVCADLVLRGPDPRSVFPQIDVHKLRSSMTLFAGVTPPDRLAVFDAVLTQHGLERDPLTLSRLGRVD
jgi:uncharacterized protein (DUF1810 family)